MKALVIVRKVVVALVGFPLLVFGIILIPLPGPGLVVSFLALALLATEFDWAKTHVTKARTKLSAIYRTSKDRIDKLEDKANKN